MKKKSPLSEKLLSYSALVSAVLAVNKQADAQILYTDIIPDDTIAVPDIFMLDLNNDGTFDFKFNLLLDSNNPGNQLRAIGYSNNAISRDPSQFSYAGYYYAKVLYNGDNIGPSLSFKSQVILATHYYNGNDFGDWIGITEGFLGLKLVANSNTYYGWIRLTTDENCHQLVAIDYAVDTIANESILAGDKCGNFSQYANTVINPSDSVIVCAENVVTFSTDSIGGYTYQWLNDNDTIPGATGFTYDATVAGSYSVIVTTAYGCTDTSSATNVSVVPAPPVPVVTQTDNTLNSSSAASYQWFLDGVAIAGATGQTYDPPTGGEYYVEITDENGCTAVSDPFTFIPVGITEMDESVSSLYAADNILFVALKDSWFLGGQIRVFNTVGDEVFSSLITDQNFQVDLNNLVRGIYLVRVMKEGKTNSGKIVIQ